MKLTVVSVLKNLLHKKQMYTDNVFEHVLKLFTAAHLYFDSALITIK